MNNKTWFIIIGLAFLLPGIVFIFPSGDDDVSARSLTTSPKQIVASAESRATLETVTLDVNSMNCASCPFIVKETLKNVPGVTKVTTDFESKTASVVFDKEKTNISYLLEALKNRGYPSTVHDNS